MKFFQKPSLFLFSSLLFACACTESSIDRLTQADRDELVLAEYFATRQLTPNRTASGLYYEVLQPGNGSIPPSGSIVRIHYTGRVLYGDIFDSSHFRGEPFVLEQGTGRIVDSFNDDGAPLVSDAEVIEGWREATQLMDIGGKFRFYIPSGLAYGPRGTSTIPPQSILVFEMEMVDILR